jgi:hypothetical protein
MRDSIKKINDVDINKEELKDLFNSSRLAKGPDGNN